MKEKRIINTLFSVTGIIILAKILGFVKQAVVAGTFGATIETDLINLSQGAIFDIQYVLAQTLISSFVAIYIHKASSDKCSAAHFSTDVLKAFSLIAVGVSILLVLLAPVIAKIIAPTYSPELSARLDGYIRLFAPVLIFFTWNAVFQALLSANKRFVPCEMIGMNQSLILVAIVILFQRQLGIWCLVLSFFISAIYNVLFLGTLSRKYCKIQRGNPFANPDVKELLRMSLPLLLGYSAVYINQQVDRILVSALSDGSVTALGYGMVLSNLVGTFIASFCGILFTYVTVHISEGDHKGAAALANWSTQLLIACFLPISIITIICAEDIVATAFGRGAFDANAIHTAGLALRGYGFIFVPLVLREVYSRIQYGYKDSRRPMINSTIGIAINIGLSIALCSRYGVLGVSFASSAAFAVYGMLDLITARRHNKDLGIRPLLPALPYLILGGIVCTAIGIWGQNIWQSYTAPIRFILTTVCAGAGYIVVISPLLIRLLRQWKNLTTKVDGAIEK